MVYFPITGAKELFSSFGDILDAPLNIFVKNTAVKYVLQLKESGAIKYE